MSLREPSSGGPDPASPWATSCRCGCWPRYSAALVLLTVLTVAASARRPGQAEPLRGPGASPASKATLVVLYFMHLRYDRPFNLVVFLGCLAFVVLFISLVLTDTQSYQPSVLPGQAQSMKDVYQPFGR